jgi:hypothetical protein
MNLLPTRLNQQLSESVLNKMSAEMSYISGKTGFWRAIGFGLLGLGLGGTIGLGFYGYSFVSRNSDNLNVLSSAFSKALADLQIHGTAVGSVELQPHEISLAKGQTVSFDDNSRLLLDPASKILVDGEVKVQTPTVSVPQTASPRSRSFTPTPTITNFTVFKSVPFEKGSIQTGWVFLTSAQKFPTSQYCYYTESNETSDISLRIDVGADEKMETPNKLSSALNIPAAFTRCVWFKKEVQ